MSDELKYALVLLFKRVKKPNPTRRDLVLTASMNLRWFSPERAEEMVSMAIEAGYLSTNGSILSLTFDPSTIQIPQGFTPTISILKKKETSDNLLMRIIQAISEKTHEEKKRVMAKVNTMVIEMNIDVEVAALLLASEMGIDVKGFRDEVKSEVMKRYGVKG